MPGIGIRVWNPPYKSGGAENPLTVVNVTVADPIGLNGTTIPFKSYTGNILVRMVGRTNTATRPLGITVKWNNTTMVQKAFYVESGAGGSFVGMWTLAGQPLANSSVVITCTTALGVTAIRVGEIGGAPVQIAADALSGPVMAFAKTPGDPLLTVGGYGDALTAPVSSANLDLQWAVSIPAKTVLPNRHNGLAAHFGINYSNTPDNMYRIKTDNTQINIAGVIGGISLHLVGAVTAHAA